jgi:uncharacterized protein with HEPN domain
MSERADEDLFRDIREAALRIKNYAAKMTYETFLADIKTQDAVIRNIEILGEATKSLSGDIRRKYRDVPWKSIAGIRDRLIHQYFGVNLDIVWDIVSTELPVLTSQVEQILRQEYGES